MENPNEPITKTTETKSFFYVIDQDTCVSCGACPGTCPTQAIIVNSRGKYEIIPVLCIFCASCADACPVNAIHPNRM